MSILVTFKDTDTGCELGYIHTNNDMPTCADIENALNADSEDGDTVSNLRAVSDYITSGTTTMVLVRYEYTYPGTDPDDLVGSLTFFTNHARSEEPGTIFMIG